MTEITLKCTWCVNNTNNHLMIALNTFKTWILITRCPTHSASILRFWIARHEKIETGRKTRPKRQETMWRHWQNSSQPFCLCFGLCVIEVRGFSTFIIIFNHHAWSLCGCELFQHPGGWIQFVSLPQRPRTVAKMDATSQAHQRGLVTQTTVSSVLCTFYGGLFW